MGLAVVRAADGRRRRTIRRIVVSGYYGFGNVGDEAVLAGIAESFRVAGGCELVPITASPDDTFARHGLRGIARSDTLGMLKEIKRADLFLSGGGSLFQDATSARSALYYLVQFWYAAKIARKPCVVYAQGVGPLRRRWVRALARRVLDRAALITLRDEQSKALLQEIGVQRPALEVTGDPSFALSPVGRDEGREFLKRHGVAEGDAVIALCPRPWGGSAWDHFAAGIADAVKDIGGQAVFLALHPARDRELACRLAEATPRSVFFEWVASFRDVRAAIAGSDLVISTRLHGLMFAVKEGVPAVGVSYDPKVEAFCVECGLPYLPLERLTSEGLMARVREAWEQRDRFSRAEREKANELARAAFRNAKMALETIAEGLEP